MSDDDSMQLTIRGETAMEALGGALAKACRGGVRIYLQGELGAGKTTLVRGFMRALGHEGAVKSPTYTVVEPYEIDGRAIYHLDLYRLAEPEELEWIGLRDLLAETALVLVEWPQQGQGVLPPADILVQIHYQGEGRQLALAAQTARGRVILAELSPVSSQAFN